MGKKKKIVFLGLSGGVDSSVAGYLLKKQGYEVIAVFIKSYNVDGCEEKDAEDARRVAEKLGLPFYVFDMREAYFSRVVAEMIEGYRNGITPNPDILCNREIKFGLFWERAKRLGADYIATGHYAQIKNKKFFAGADTNKDQSYFLWKLKDEDLQHSLFPIGEYTKPEIRILAKKAGLPTALKKDSQGICFLGKVKLPEFLKKYINAKSGDIIDTEGNIIGKHDGAQFYTIGQRHIGTQVQKKQGGSDPKRFYIAEKDTEKNILVVAEGENHSALYKKEVVLAEVSFVQKQNRKIKKIKILCRIRYRQSLIPAVLEIRNSCLPAGMAKFKIKFDHPVKFVARGQSAVFYKENGEVLGGGVIV